MPASQYFDAVGNGSLDAAWTVPGFFTGKDIAFAMYSTVPFGPEVGEYLAWMKYGGGEKLMQELHAKYNIDAIPCGLISPEASGWFRKEIKTLDDLKGLKMRFFGLGANVMQKLGVATQLLQAGEIFQALQLGTIDATEFSMPVMDLTLGFHQVAKFYYFPGWHQMSTFNVLFISKAKWAELSRHAEGADRDRLRRAPCCTSSPRARRCRSRRSKELQAKGVQLNNWSQGVPRRLSRRPGTRSPRSRPRRAPNSRRPGTRYTRSATTTRSGSERGYLKIAGRRGAAGSRPVACCATGRRPRRSGATVAAAAN